MPAAAVIPAPLAYTIIVAVKRLVVGLNTNITFCKHTHTYHKNIFQHCEQIRVYKTCRFYCALNVLSWNVALEF